MALYFKYPTSLAALFQCSSVGKSMCPANSRTAFAISGYVFFIAKSIFPTKDLYSDKSTGSSFSLSALDSVVPGYPGVEKLLQGPNMSSYVSIMSLIYSLCCIIREPSP